MGIKQLREDLKKAQETFNLEDHYLASISRDDLTLTVDLAYKDIKETYLFLVPDTYPKGDFIDLTSGSKPRQFPSLEMLLWHCIATFCEAKELTVPFDHPAMKLGANNTGGTTSSELDLHKQPSSGYVDDDELYGFETENKAATAYLEEDIALYTRKMGRDSAGLIKKAISDWVVRIAIPVSRMDNTMCEIYGINPRARIVVELKLNFPHLLWSSKQPLVDVIQSSDADLSVPELATRKQFGLSWQMNQRLNAFLHEDSVWPNKIRHDMKETELHKIEPQQPKPREVAPLYPKDVDLEALRGLVEMGFDELIAACVLSHCKNNQERAAFMLIQDPETYMDIVQKKQHELLAPEVIWDDVPSIDFTGKGNCFLLTVAQFVDWALHNCNERCIICDRPLAYKGLKPSICDRGLCNYSFEQYGLGSDLATEVRYNPELVDMLISFAVAGLAIREDWYEPFPSGVYVEVPSTSGTKRFEFSHKGKKDMTMLRNVLELFPSLESMRKHAQSEQDLHNFLNDIHPLSFPLLRWLITSNRAHIKPLPKEKHIKSMTTPHQFLMLSSAPEKEKQFRERKKQYGSHYAFHGSAAQNWHSILRGGLRNMSGTDRMLHGAASGSGIYLAQNASLSFGYMSLGPGWKKSMFGSEIACIVLAEVIKINSYGKGGVWVVPKNEDVVTRYFFIYSNRNGMNGNCDSLSLTPPKSDYFT